VSGLACPDCQGFGRDEEGVICRTDEARGMLVREPGIYAENDFAKDPEVHELTEPFCAFVYGGG
jgi:hypothetical protein